MTLRSIMAFFSALVVSLTLMGCATTSGDVVCHWTPDGFACEGGVGDLPDAEH